MLKSRSTISGKAGYIVQIVMVLLSVACGPQGNIPSNGSALSDTEADSDSIRIVYMGVSTDTPKVRSPSGDWVDLYDHKFIVENTLDQPIYFNRVASTMDINLYYLAIKKRKYGWVIDYSEYRDFILDSIPKHSSKPVKVSMIDEADSLHIGAAFFLDNRLTIERKVIKNLKVFQQAK